MKSTIIPPFLIHLSLWLFLLLHHYQLVHDSMCKKISKSVKLANEKTRR